MDAEELRAGSQLLQGLCVRLLPVLARYRQGKESGLHYMANVFDPGLLRSLPLPTDDNLPLAQTVTLLGDWSFDRPSRDDIQTAYSNQPRTRVFEGINFRNDGWSQIVGLQLARLLRVRVACSVFVSVAGDDTLHAHHDDWFGVVIQCEGAKEWTLWVPGEARPRRLTTYPGDVLLLPREVKHRTATPQRSTHLLFPIYSQSLEAAVEESVAAGV